MSVFFFIPNDSFLHRRDPRIKIAGLFFFCALAMVEISLRGQGLICTGLLLFFGCSRVLASLKKMAGIFVLIGSMTFILWVVFYRGETKWMLWGVLPVSVGALSHAGVMSLRFLNMLLSGLLFLSVTSIEDFYGGLVVLGTPYPFAFAMSLSFRLVMIFMSNAFSIVEAQKVRGNDILRGNILKRIRAYAPLIVPLILTGVKKAETLTLALESKGFSPQNKIDLSGKYRFGAADGLCLCVMLLAGTVAVWMRCR